MFVTQKSVVDLTRVIVPLDDSLWRGDLYGPSLRVAGGARVAYDLGVAEPALLDNAQWVANDARRECIVRARESPERGFPAENL